MDRSSAFQSPLSNIGFSNASIHSSPFKCSFSRSSFVTTTSRPLRSQIQQRSPGHVLQPIRMVINPDLPSAVLTAFLHLTSRVDLGPFSNVDVESAGLFGAITAGSLLAAFIAVFIARF